MRVWREKAASWTLLLLVTMMWTLGCGSKPTPLAALPGATITLSVGGDDNPGFSPLRGPLGYGSRVYDSSFGPDLQRGELEVRLLDGSAEGFPLVTRLVLRVYPDPASETGIAETAPHPLWAPAIGIAQTIAVIDIPADAPPSVQPYRLQVRTVRRDPQGNVVAVLNDMTHRDQRLTILDPARCGVLGEPTPNDALMLSQYSEDATPFLSSLVPHAKLLVDLHPGVHVGTPGNPAAAHLELVYPSGVSIRSVFEDRRLGRGSLVSWRDDPVTRRLVAELVAPKETVRYLAIVFESTSTVAPSDFSVDAATGTLYDRDGNELERLAVPVGIQ